MHVVTGITGQVGGAVARNLLSAGKGVRGVVRDRTRGEPWARQGCALALAEMHDRAALARAFADAESVFVLFPSSFDPEEGFPEVRELAATVAGALRDARPGRVVCLSTIGAQAREMNLLSQLGLIEEALGGLPVPVIFVRPGWFMENTLWDIAPARDKGVIQSFLTPIDHGFPMVATADVGRAVADLMLGQGSASRVHELTGPDHVSPVMIADTLARLLGRDVRAEAVPRGQWEAIFRSQGMRNPLPRMRMLDGFNEGWICFEHAPCRGSTPLEAVLRGLVDRGG